MIDGHRLGGRFHLLARKPDGAFAGERVVDNLVTTEGRSLLVKLLNGEIQLHSGALSIGVGRSSRAPSYGDKQLEEYVDSAPASLRSTTSTENGSALVAKIEATLPRLSSGGPEPLMEAGMLVTLSDGVAGSASKKLLYNRVIFPVINRSQELELTLTWEVVF